MAEYYVSHLNDIGDGAEHGAGTVNDPWNQIQTGLDNTAGGDRLNVKADESYIFNGTDQGYDSASRCLLKNLGGGANNDWDVTEGYNTTIGDGGQVTLDFNATSARSGFGIAKSGVIAKNFILTNIASSKVALEFLGSNEIQVVVNITWINSGNLAITTSANNRNVLIRDCTFSDCDTGASPFLILSSCTFIGCNFNGSSGGGNGLIDIQATFGEKIVLINNILTNINIGVRLWECNLILINNTFYGISDKCVYIWNPATDTPTLLEYNNIYIVTDAANDHAIHREKGMIVYADYSLTSSSRAGGMLDINSLGMNYGGNSLSQVGALMVNPAGGDFRLKPNSLCLNTGKPSLGPGITSMGAFQRKSFLGVD